MRFAVLVALLILSGCMARQDDGYYENSRTYEEDEASMEYAMNAGNPVSNLREEGFIPLPGYRNAYVIPESGLMAKCSDNFTLNLSMKRTYRCYYLDRKMRKIPGSDFDVQINPWRGDGGFTPHR